MGFLPFLSLAVFGALTAQESGWSAAGTRYGFTLERPGEDWIWTTAEKTAGAAFVLSLFPRGTQGLPSAVLYVSDATAEITAERAAEAGLTKLRAQGAEEIERGEARTAEHAAPRVRARMDTPLGPAALEYVFHVEHDYLYTLQLARGPDDEVGRGLLEDVLGSLAFHEPVREVEAPERVTWRALAARCAADLGWCASWEAASARAREEQKLVLVVVQNYAALGIPSTLRSGPFLDPDLAALVRERFVPLELGAALDAPFRDPAVYGLGEHAWGTGFLFVDADGRVQAECGISDASTLDEFARGVLARHGRDAGRADESAEQAFARGELARALELVKEKHTPQAQRLRAAVARRQRDGKTALAELGAARERADEELEPELAADEALVLLRTGETTDARRAFERLLERWPAHARGAEARFTLGALDVQFLGVEAGGARWRELVESQPDSPWAAKAAANLLGEGHFVGGAERLEWPAPELLAEVAPLERARGPAPALDDVRRSSVDWLVAHQKEDGSWWVPMDGFTLGSSLYTPAVSALCAASLVPEVRKDDVRAAVERALDRALELHGAGRLEADASLAGVYSIWSRTYVLRLFLDARAAGLGDEARLTSAIDSLVRSIAASQDRRGGWPYVILPGDPRGEGLDPSASFLTAGVALVLADARAAGVEVDGAVLERGLAFLERVRQPDGTFRYMADLPIDASRTLEAYGRGPLCALALGPGKSDALDLVRSTLALFLEGRAQYRAEWHKTLCHTAQNGFGAHYVLYDYLFAARAMRALPPDEQGPVRAALIEDLLAERSSDGSFEDLPGLGRAYGTAMALETLRLCER